MRVPGECEYEAKTLRMGKGVPKSCCTIKANEIWTNCRAAGHCLFDDADLQLSLFEFEEEEDE